MSNDVEGATPITKQQLAALPPGIQRLMKIRPMRLAALLVKVAAPVDRRKIVNLPNGHRFYVDPLSRIGLDIAETGQFEPETVALFDELLRPGESFLDIGANEGFFTSYAARLVGQEGLVVSVEPQERLQDLIDINVSLNGPCNRLFFQNAFGMQDGAEMEIILYPFLNTGASGFYRSKRYGIGKQVCRFISINTIFEKAQRDHFDLVKVDTEGFEDHVVEGLETVLRDGKIRGLMVDYHASVLKDRKVDPTSIERRIEATGMVCRSRTDEYSGYRVYVRP